MKRHVRYALLTSLLLAGGPVTRGLAQGTAFTYQGRLTDAGAPASGTYDLSFALFDAGSGGNQAGPALTNSSVALSNGVFTVALDFGPGIFTGPAYWLEIGVRPTGGGGDFTVLAPRQSLTPAPNALFASLAGDVAAGAVTAAKLGSGQVVKSLNGLRDDLTLAAGANVTIAPSGNTLTISSAGVGGTGIWSVNGNNAYYNAGNVGIGTSTPNHRLSLIGGPGWTANGWAGSGELANASAIGWQANAAGQRFGMGHSGGGFYLFRTLSDPGTTGSPALYDFAVDDSGRVGIGTITPSSKLEIAAQDALRLVGYQPFLTMLDSNAGYARSRIQGVNGDVGLFTESYLDGANPFAFLKLANNGNVGVGSALPVGKLEVVAQDALRLVGYQPFLTILDSDTGYARSRIQGAGGEMILMPESYLNGSDANAYVKLFNSGNLSVKTLTIRGGADLAEPFELSAAEVAKGSVVIIDDEHPGKLKLSSRAYDTRVAGVVSGANGISPGLSLHQEGLVEGGQNVALSGRVYVLADATDAAIRPGDLLTTSSVRGHAMKVTDHAKAQGAILGKAMSALDQGEGMVLVLVTLQ